MSRISVVQRNIKRINKSKYFKKKRLELKCLVMNKKLEMPERFKMAMELSKMPRDSSISRVRNRCNLTGRPRGYYRKLGLSRIKLREMAGFGLIPGIRKSSW